ncbi:hypothetical protein TNCV_1217731 [Trichonephila clavipes]|nr:hypothetical protein TNCV_1217731 [Trichonephila clavipes]
MHPGSFPFGRQVANMVIKWPNLVTKNDTSLMPKNRRHEEEPMDWNDVPFLTEVSAPFVPSRPPRKMRSLISVQVSEPPSLSANRFPTMRALVPKTEGSVSLRSRGCPLRSLKRAASRNQSSRPPSGVPRATLCIELMTAANGLLRRVERRLSELIETGYHSDTRLFG